MMEIRVGRSSLCTTAAVALVLTPAAATAQTGVDPQPQSPLSSVMECASIADPGNRLSCFDREVRKIGEAQRSGELVVMNRQQARKTTRSLFGLALPDLGVFGGGDGEGAVSEIETSIVAAQQDGRGRWTLDLAESGRWVQVDSKQMIIDPAPGQPIRIRRAALGSYLANVNNQTAIRVRRHN